MKSGENQDSQAVDEKTSKETIESSLLRKYKDKIQLYVRFPHKIPEDDDTLNGLLQKISDSIVKVHRPRQKYARFCLVDFKDSASRERVVNASKNRKTEFTVSIPRTENGNFVKKLAEKIIRKKENKKAKHRMKKAEKMSKKQSTSSIIVQNIPECTVMSEIKEIFPTAVDIILKTSPRGKSTSTAVIILPSTLEAEKLRKQSITLNGNKLFLTVSKPFKKR